MTKSETCLFSFVDQQKILKFEENFPFIDFSYTPVEKINDEMVLIDDETFKKFSNIFTCERVLVYSENFQNNDILNFSDESEFLDLFNFLKIQQENDSYQEFLEKVYINSRKILIDAVSICEYLRKSIVNYTKSDVVKDQKLSEFIDFYIGLSKFKKKLLGNLSYKEFNKEIQTFLSEKLKREVFVFSQSEFSKKWKKFKEYDVFCVERESCKLFVCLKSASVEGHHAFHYGPLYIIFLKFLFIDKKLSLKSKSDLVWEQSFMSLPCPIALFSCDGELLQYNQEYLKLDLSSPKCFAFKNNDTIEIKNEHYYVDRKKFQVDGKDVNLFQLNKKLSDSQDNPRPSSEELGIVTSSIAHELNNPIAGILAALSLAELEDYWSDEELEEIQNMKSSAVRCKELVSIFLGFSRAVPLSKNSGDPLHHFSKSLELLKFRTIEANIKLSIDPIKEDDFNLNLNDSISVMIFYLIISEVMTYFSHHRLVVGRIDNLLKGKFIEKKNSLEIEFDSSFNIEKILETSRLIQYLVDLIELSISSQKNKIILSEWRLT